MKICLCCSLTFTNEVTEIAKMLESMGHEVLLPNGVINRLTDQPDFDPVRTKIETDSCHTHVDKIRAADVVLVCNFLKNCTAGYIGANSFAELFAAHYFDKPIFALFPLPNQPYIADELESFGIKVLNGSLEAFDNHTPSSITDVANDPAPSSGSSPDTAACPTQEPVAKVEVEPEPATAAEPTTDTFDPLANLKTAFAKVRTSWDNFWNK